MFVEVLQNKTFKVILPKPNMHSIYSYRSVFIHIYNSSSVMVVVNYKIRFYIVSHIGLQSKQNQNAESIAQSISRINSSINSHINRNQKTYQYGVY